MKRVDEKGMNLKIGKNLKKIHKITIVNNFGIILLFVLLIILLLYNNYMYNKLKNEIKCNNTDVIKIVDDKLSNNFLKEAITLVPPTITELKEN